MKKFVRILSGVLLALLMLCAIPAGAQSDRELYPDYLAEVQDVDDLLTDDEEFLINASLELAREKAGIPICAYVFSSQYTYSGHEKYWGDDFLAEHELRDDAPLVLLVVTVTHFETYYDIYTYGDAYQKINQKEIEYLLDDSRVYDNLKSGEIAEGLCAYAELSAQAYAGRLGVSWVLILIVALIIGSIVGGLSVGSIKASYKRKNPTTSYPLDRFATLDLTHSHDREVGKFVTTTIVSSGGRGGRGGGGGGFSGGGGGHRGGR